MSHRQIARTLKISHGSVSLERKIMRAEEQARQEKLAAELSAQTPAPESSIDFSAWGKSET